MYEVQRPYLDFDTARIQYELLGDPFQKISINLEIAVDALERVATAEGWKRIPQTPASYKNYLVDVLGTHQSKISLAAIYRETMLFPKVAQVEDLLVEKIYQTADRISPHDTKSPTALRALSNALDIIVQRHNAMNKNFAEMINEPSATQGVNINMIGVAE